MEGKPNFTSIYWEIHELYEDIYKYRSYPSDPNGSLLRHTVLLEWKTNDMESRKRGDQAELKCKASNSIGGGVDYPVIQDIQCKYL